MEYCDFKMFTRVLWQFMTKFVPLTHVFWCAVCKRAIHLKVGGWIHLKVVFEMGPDFYKV